MKILHIEDDSGVLTGLKRLLNAYEFDDLCQVCDLESAKAAIIQFQPDVIITDGSYPLIKDGVEDTSAWQQLCGYLRLANKRIPVIVNSSSNPVAQIVEMSLPFEATYAPKPDFNGVLINKLLDVQAILKGKS